jgi:ATP-dependent DNA helicase RecG
LVEASENSEGESAVEYQKMLEESFGNEVKVGLLHGKMKPKEKNAMMESFAKGDVDVLVSTTVVEVGVNVPNATVMVIEDAHRFGLAQLHQLRGRVGRGDAQSYCIFVDGSNAKEMSKRLKVMGSSNDGFYVANEDLKLRGPGDFLGIRQSGEMNFHLADIYQDADMMKIASSFADRVLMEDAELVEGNHCYLKEYLELYASKVYTNL